MPDGNPQLRARKPLALSLGRAPASLSFIDLRCRRVALAQDGHATVAFNWEDGNSALEIEIPLDEAIEFRIGELYRFDIGPRPCPAAAAP